MPKKAGDTLTGGSKDVNPQWWTIPLLNGGQQIATTPSGSAQGIQLAAPIPVNRLNQPGNKALVMEVLKIRYNFEQSLGFQGSSFTGSSFTKAYVATAPFQQGGGVVGNYGPANPKVLDFCSTDLTFTYEQTLPAFYAQDGLNEMPIIHDLTDGDGHGVLVATDQLYFSLVTILQSINSTDGVILASNTCDIGILYRWKEVMLQEYIGIVQSQQ